MSCFFIFGRQNGGIDFSHQNITSGIYFNYWAIEYLWKKAIDLNIRNNWDSPY